MQACEPKVGISSSMWVVRPVSGTHVRGAGARSQLSDWPCARVACRLAVESVRARRALTRTRSARHPALDTLDTNRGSCVARRPDCAPVVRPKLPVYRMATRLLAPRLCRPLALARRRSSRPLAEAASPCASARRCVSASSATYEAPAAEASEGNRGGRNTDAPCFQAAIQRLQEFWASKGCIIWQPHNTEVRGRPQPYQQRSFAHSASLALPQHCIARVLSSATPVRYTLQSCHLRALCRLH